MAGLTAATWRETPHHGRRPRRATRDRPTFLSLAEARVLRIHLERLTAIAPDALVIRHSSRQPVDIAHHRGRAWKVICELAFLIALR